jgi:hypothetical protein
MAMSFDFGGGSHGGGGGFNMGQGMATMMNYGTEAPLFGDVMGPLPGLGGAGHDIQVFNVNNDHGGGLNFAMTEHALPGLGGGPIPSDMYRHMAQLGEQPYNQLMQEYHDKFANYERGVIHDQYKALCEFSKSHHHAAQDFMYFDQGDRYVFIGHYNKDGTFTTRNDILLDQLPKNSITVSPELDYKGHYTRIYAPEHPEPRLLPEDWFAGKPTESDPFSTLHPTPIDAGSKAEVHDHNPFQSKTEFRPWFTGKVNEDGSGYSWNKDGGVTHFGPGGLPVITSKGDGSTEVYGVPPEGQPTITLPDKNVIFQNQKIVEINKDGTHTSYDINNGNPEVIVITPNGRDIRIGPENGWKPKEITVQPEDIADRDPNEPYDPKKVVIGAGPDKVYKPATVKVGGDNIEPRVGYGGDKLPLFDPKNNYSNIVIRPFKQPGGSTTESSVTAENNLIKPSLKDVITPLLTDLIPVVLL